MIEAKNLRPWEKKVKTIKVHWIAYVILWVQIFFVLLVSILFCIIIKSVAIDFLLITLLWLISSVVLYIEWLNYELDLLIVTTNRIIWVEQISFLNRTVSETNLNQIVEVNSKTKWFFANIFNYWDIFIQTAGNKTTISIKMCPNATHEARAILNIVETYKEWTKTDNLNNEWKNWI
jgi:hypothetical protein